LGTQHPCFDEWVYNDADIDPTEVVWARDMGSSVHVEFIRYFKSRRVWLLEAADESPPEPVPYVPLDGSRADSLAEEQETARR